MDKDKIFERLYDKNNSPAVMFFPGKDKNQNPARLELFKNIANQLKSTNLIFGVGSVKGEVSNDFMDLVGIKTADAPQLAACINSDSDHLQNFLYTGDWTLPDIKDWIQRFREGKLERHVKSEPVPENDKVDGIIQILTGKTFRDFVPSDNCNLVVFFYTPDNRYTKKVRKVSRANQPLSSKFRSLVSIDLYRPSDLLNLANSIFVLPKFSPNSFIF